MAHSLPAASTRAARSRSRHQLQFTSPRESYLTRVSNDPCSHAVSSHTRVARDWLRTRGRGAERGCSSKQGPSPWASGLCTALVPGHALHPTATPHFPCMQPASRHLPDPQSWVAGRASRALQRPSHMLKLAPHTSAPLLTACKYSPRAARLIKKRIVKNLSFFRLMIPFLKKSKSRC